MPDLVSRLLEAIAAKEAQENRKKRPGWKRGTPCIRCGAEADILRDTCNSTGYTWARLEPCGCEFLGHEAVVEVLAFEPCPDEDVLRWCAGIRAVISLHREDLEGGFPRLKSRGNCVTCSCNGSLAGNDCWYVEPWPCPTLKALALGYGISVEEETT